MLDILIKNASVLDGTGAAPFAADLAIQNGRIKEIGQFPYAQARQVIDAAGKYVTPGFVDIHQHADGACLRPGFGEAQLRQGLTTIVNGNCGLSLAPVSGPWKQEILDYLRPVTGEIGQNTPIERLSDYEKAVHSPIHQGMLVGLGTLRASVAGYGAEPLSGEQLRAIHRLMEQALSDGALGVSLGLGYAPECFFSTEELVKALWPLYESGVPVTVHVRNEGDGLVRSVDEMIHVARMLRTPVHISHLKAIGRKNWGKTIPEVLKHMENAREDGLEISCDAYPYTAGSTQLTHILPPEFLLGGTGEICRRLREPAWREKLAERLATGTDFENIVLLVGWENIYGYGLTMPENQAYEGLSVAEAAEMSGKTPMDFACDLLVSERCGVTMIDFIASEGDLAMILRDSHSCVISDSIYPTHGQLHPRVFGTFSRVLERYVREKNVLSLPEAIVKITSAPLKTLRIAKKGRIQPNFDADLNIFSLHNIIERGTYQNPDCLSEGMDWVLVGGIPAIADGVRTASENGGVL